ncbi:EAL domain-containing protein [Psychromonas sp. MME1]|uniref:bifunctional diguanylate cyclase/phosphodiesterase n=1 Tax=Psychromonas sp. MME1 TaxID=3231032 RepID=UPI0034E2188B
MTLFNQINSLLFGLFLLVMCSLVYFQFTETRAFMTNQMESDLNNTTTSLSLMLKPHLEVGDTATVDTLINVIFEGGFYQKVNLIWLSDQKEQVWENPIVSREVPQWFIDLQLFEPQVSEVVITSGWLQLAKLKIESNPAIGYRELWRIMNDTAMVLSALFLLSIFLMRLRLKSILRPLHEVATHAADIAKRNFSQDMPLPKTRELSDVVAAINSMSGQLQLVFSSLDDQVKTLKHDKLIDPVSTLPNRLYLTGQLNSWLDEPGFGGLMLAKLDWLEDIHSKYGFKVRDETIKVLANQFKSVLSNNAIIARISNTEFAFVVMKADKEQLTTYLQSLIRLINQEMTKAGCQSNSNFAIGIAERVDEVTRMELLSQADNALQQALQAEQVSSWYSVNTQQGLSREDWRTRLSDAISNNQFILQWQPINLIDSGNVMHREVYSRLQIDNKIVPAGQFMPYVERSSLGTSLDRCLLQNIADKQLLTMVSEPIAVNLCRESLVDLEFHAWLTEYLQSVENTQMLHFDLPESGVTNDLEICLELCNIINNAGARFGVDNCGRQLDSLDYLREIQPYYIKLDLSLSSYGSNEEVDRQYNLSLCQALISIAHGLNIKVVMTGIQNEQHLQSMRSLHTEAYQGFIDPPVAITNL